MLEVACAVSSGDLFGDRGNADLMGDRWIKVCKSENEAMPGAESSSFQDADVWSLLQGYAF